MHDQQFLLTDEQMRHFISHGYLILKTDFPASFHETLNRKLQEVMSKEGNPGNNILPRLTEVQEVFTHPVITGALTSAVGPDYIMHPHRHCHYTSPGRRVQNWHKDSYWGYAKVRNHHPWWAMLFYYPQDVTDEMGPSAIIPGGQYYHKRTGDDSELQLEVTGEAGTFILIHYDMWHRGGANMSTRDRAMMKFQFVRMSAPEAPTWNHQGTAWQPMNGDGPTNRHETAWQHQWQWLSGGSATENGNGAAPNNASSAQVAGFIEELASENPRIRMTAADELGLMGKAAGEAIPALAAALGDDYEPVALNATYALANMGEAALPALLDALHAANKAMPRNAGYALGASGASVLSGLVDALAAESTEARGHAAFALGELRAAAQSATPALTELASDESAWVRRNVVEALGTIGVPTEPIVATLSDALADEDDQVRFTSGLSLTRLGSAATGAIPALATALNDENRYVRANAADALRQIGTSEAKDLLIDYLMRSRWCQTTTPENTF